MEMMKMMKMMKMVKMTTPGEEKGAACKTRRNRVQKLQPAACSPRIGPMRLLGTRHEENALENY